MKEHGMSREELRQKAIELYNASWTVPEICSTLGCSRSWFYKWLNRYYERDEPWFKDQSRTPKSIPTKVDPVMEQRVVTTRKKLMSAPFSQYGPQAIHYAIHQQGYTPPPVLTIARILRRHELVRSKRQMSYIPKGKVYPYQYILSHQMDFVGPRYLSSKARYYFLSIIDCDSHWTQTSVLENRQANSACSCLIQFWKTVGVPDFLQMDNDPAFWGSIKKPGAVGKVIRLCLLLGVTPVFIPQGKPWRNGVIEHSNRTMQDRLLKHDEYASVRHLQEAAVRYDQVHNETRHYSSQNGMTPKKAFTLLEYPIVPLHKAYKVPDGDLPLESGEIHVIRFIRSDRKFNLFGLSFLLPEVAKYEYVKGVIFTDEHRLLILKNHQLIADLRFTLS